MNPELIFADTNIFLRYLTNDVPDQADAVEALLGRAAAGDLVLVTNSLVVAEIVWTLESFYHLSREEIQEKVIAILGTHGVEVSDTEVILQAILWYQDKNVDFIDAFNAAWVLEKGLDRVCSFDRKHFNRFEELEVVVPGGRSDCDHCGDR
jgi:predicted nucleic-acid-binding protein